MLSNTCKYAIRAMIFIAGSETKENVGIKKIAEEIDIPAPFLSKILQQLAKQGLLHSTKGPHGGFILSDKPENISIYDIIMIIDGPALFEQCILGLGICKKNKELVNICPVHPKSEPLREEIAAFFKDLNLASISKKVYNNKLKNLL
jgi:Rrf2 family transcriptional regulator, iron-sulfur cluster assembly transcription factor